MWIRDVARDIKERRVSGIIFQHEAEPFHNRPEDLARAKEMLAEALGEEWVTDDPVILIGYSRDQGPLPAQYPHLVVMPESTEEVAEVYRIANECRIDVIPMGTGLTTMALHIPMYGGIIMDLRRMDKILEVDGENMYMVIQPGVNYLAAQVEAQKVRCRVLNPSTAATAGVISNHAFCNINTLASKYGFGIDNIIDMTMVMPDGTILKTGPAAYGAVKAHVPGPGPDMASLFRYAYGTLGTVTEMTLRLYPEPEHIYQIFPAYEKDDLKCVIDVLYKVANENLTLELAHMQNSFFGIFVGATNAQASAIAGTFPRNNLFTIFAGSTPEEARLKAEIIQREILKIDPEWEFLPPEAVEDLTGDLRSVNLDRWQKYFNVTVRVMRVRGSFLIGALIGHLDNFLEAERSMRVVTSDQAGHTDDNLPPDDASTYLQPYHMGRSAYMEYDLYSNQGDKDDNMRMLMTYFRAMFQGQLAHGLVLAAGALPLYKGMPAPLPEGMPKIDDLIPLIMPNVAPYVDTFTAFKMAVDPNNIANRRWDYQTGLCKKIYL
ncbi:FAD-binding oxidoreductase [Candidatus Solincola tengchongensis]|uniref:FAD-binding oxidoreductase n=1 Tax=Candidatus Solincola tengchongensis TaxID=2900693 RepID=UPI002579E54E|nr:FAD-binding oxidoreductase [Candidatus Solincola tengchongensis]